MNLLIWIFKEGINTLFSNMELYIVIHKKWIHHTWYILKIFISIMHSCSGNSLEFMTIVDKQDLSIKKLWNKATNETSTSMHFLS